MPYPRWRAGQRVTAALLNAGQTEIAETSGDQANATMTMKDVVGLGFWGLANARYRCELWVGYDGTADARFQWWPGTGGSMMRNLVGLSATAATAADNNVLMVRHGAFGFQTAGVIGAAPAAVYHEVATLRTGGADGWVSVQYCAAAAGSVTVLDGSVLFYEQLA